MKKTLITFFAFLSAFCFSRDYKVTSPYNNSNIALQPTGAANAVLPYKGNAVSDGRIDLGASGANWNYLYSNSAVIGGVTIIKSDQPLSADMLPNMDNTNVYASHINGVSDFDGTAWSGGVDLTEIGAITQGKDHLGSTVYNTGNGDDGFYLSGIPAGQNANFSAWAWVKINNISANRHIVSRYSATNSEKSFSIGIDSGSGSLVFSRWYNAAGSSTDVFVHSFSKKINDGKYHFVGCSYKYLSSTEAWTLCVVDGVTVNYGKLTSNTGRNDDGGANVTFGGLDSTGNLYGSMADVGFIQGPNAWMTPNQWRKIYAVGAGKFASIDRGGVVSIASTKKANLSMAVDENTTLTNVDKTIRSFYTPETGDYHVSFCARMQGNAEDRGCVLSFDGAQAMTSIFNTAGSPDYYTVCNQKSAGYAVGDAQIVTAACSTGGNNNITVKNVDYRIISED